MYGGDHGPRDSGVLRSWEQTSVESAPHPCLLSRLVSRQTYMGQTTHAWDQL